MFDLFEKIEEAIRELLTNFVSSNLTTMFTDVNDKTGTIAAEVGQTPQAWNSGIFNMIESLSNSVIIPIAGMIITFVLCYELISMVTERNNMHEIDTWMFFKWVFKSFIAVYLLSLIHISEPTRQAEISYAVFCLKKKKKYPKNL